MSSSDSTVLDPDVGRADRRAQRRGQFSERVEQSEVWMIFFAGQCRRTLGQDFVPPGGYHITTTGFIGALNALLRQWSIGDTVLAAVTEVLNRFLVDECQ